ncbi:MAG: hypothetical protein ABFS12_11680 [Bacteroidota bacterium]
MNLKNEHPLEDPIRLDRLNQFLSYEIKSSVLILVLWIPMVFLLVVSLLIFAAAVFSPYMLYILFQEKRHGWIATFILIVLIPLLFFLVFAPKLFFLVLMPFYFYCYVLRMVVYDWIQERNARRNLYLKKIESQKKKEKEGNLEYLTQK